MLRIVSAGINDFLQYSKLPSTFTALPPYDLRAFIHCPHRVWHVSFKARYHMHLAPLESMIYFRSRRRYFCVICALARDRLSIPSTSTRSNREGVTAGFLTRMMRAEFGRIESLFNPISPSNFNGPASLKCTDRKDNGQPAGLFDNHTGMNGPSDRVCSAIWFWMRTGSDPEHPRPFAEESTQIIALPSSSKPALGLTIFSLFLNPA
jgi:hypothetical protein